MHDFDKNSGEKCPFMAEADALDAQKTAEKAAAQAAAAQATASAADSAAPVEMSAEEEIASLHAQLAQEVAAGRERRMTVAETLERGGDQPRHRGIVLDDVNQRLGLVAQIPVSTQWIRRRNAPAFTRSQRARPRAEAPG